MNCFVLLNKSVLKIKYFFFIKLTLEFIYMYILKQIQYIFIYY